jgi:hypothetical protein
MRKTSAAARILALLLLAAAAPMPNGSVAIAPGPVYEPAPVPDQDLYAPIAPPNNDPRLAPSLFHTQEQFRGDGYSPGSTSQSYEERNWRPTPGVNFTVPLK